MHTVCSIWPYQVLLLWVRFGPESNGNEWVLHIPQISKARAELSDCLMLYPGHLLGKSYPSAKMQLVYSTAPADWAFLLKRKKSPTFWEAPVLNLWGMQNTSSLLLLPGPLWLRVVVYVRVQSDLLKNYQVKQICLKIISTG